MCVVKALEVDEKILEQEMFIDSLEMNIYGVFHDMGYSGTYKMGGLEHSPYGHEGKSSPLNFAAPLVIISMRRHYTKLWRRNYTTKN